MEEKQKLNYTAPEMEVVAIVSEANVLTVSGENYNPYDL